MPWLGTVSIQMIVTCERQTACELSTYLNWFRSYCLDFFSVNHKLSIRNMAATSMAAALAASLPAPQAASVPAAPTYEAIPASMSKVVDIEAEIPLTCVQIDGLVSEGLQKHKLN